MSVAPIDLEAVVELARREFDAGNYDDAERILDVLIARGGPVLGDAALLRARLAIRRGNAMTAVTVLGDARPVFTPVQLVESHLHLMLAYAFSGDSETASDYARYLERSDVSIPQRLACEITHGRASAAWAKNDVPAVELELSRCPPHDDLRSHARHLQLTAAIAGRRELYSHQVEILLEALETIERDSDQDLPLAAAMLRSLCITLREIVPQDDQVEFAAAFYRGFPWTRELAADRVVCALHLAWIQALRGDQLGAARYANDANQHAVTKGWLVAALTDRAAIKAATGEATSALLDMEQALSLAESIEWAETQDEERLYLCSLAELACPINPSRAQALLLRSNMLARSGNQRLAYHSNRRVHAIAQHAAGVIAAALANHAHALDSLQASYAVFTELKCASRAAESALALFRVTKDDAWLKAAAKSIKPFPQSYIAKAARALMGATQDTAMARLTPRQHEVFKGLLEGLNAAAIADQIGVRPNTIKVHITGVYNAFGVSSQRELQAEARRRNLA